MAEAENIQLYRRLIEEGVGPGNLDVIAEVLHPDIALPTMPPMVEPTIAGLRQVNEMFRAGVPDARATIDEIFASGDWVAARLTWTGTQTGEFMGLPATGKSFQITEIEIVRCEDGRIVDLRQLIDIQTLMAVLAG